MHTWPLEHPLLGPVPHAMGADPQTPPWHVSLVAQSVSTEQVHCIPVCVVVHWAAGPHWLFVVQLWQTWLMHTSPAVQLLFWVHDVHPPRHSTQTWMGSQLPMMPLSGKPKVWQNPPRPQPAFEEQKVPGGATQRQLCPAGQVEQFAQTPPWHVSHAGQSRSDVHAETHCVVARPGSCEHTEGAVQGGVHVRGGAAAPPSLETSPPES
jgi:hypothetical protein